MIITQIASSCAWCLQEQGTQPKEESHGICSKHAQAEYDRYKAERARPTHTLSFPVVQPTGARGLCGHIARDENSYCGSPHCSPWAW